MVDLTLREGLERYRTQISILKKGYAQEKYRIETICRSFLGTKITRSITSVDIATYRDQRLSEINPRTGRPLATSTVRLEMSLLSNYFDVGRIEWGICDANPVANVRKPKAPPGRDRRLTAREERLILRYCHGHQNIDLYSIVVLALETAMRQGEILKLRWEHLNLKTRIAHLPETKNGSKRDVPLSVKARDALIRMGVKTNGRVFGYTAQGLKSTWRFMLIKLGIEDLHFHDLRHEAISRLFELGSLDMLSDPGAVARSQHSNTSTCISVKGSYNDGISSSSSAVQECFWWVHGVRNRSMPRAGFASRPYSINSVRITSSTPTTCHSIRAARASASRSITRAAISASY